MSFLRPLVFSALLVPVLHAATLHGSVDPCGSDTTVTFQVSLDAAFRRPISLQSGTVGAGQGTTEVSATVSRLLPNRTYWFRIVTTNGNNQVPQPGPVLTFSTPPRPRR